MMERTEMYDPTRAKRLEALRETLDHRLDELATAGGAGLDRVHKEFDRAWKELNELLGNQTLH